MKQIKYLLMAFIALFTCVSFSACSDDDDEGGFTGNYVPVESMEESLRDWGEEEPSMWNDKECQLGAISFNFMNVNPAKRNVLDLKNEACKNREKRNVLKISHTRHFKTTKKQSKMGCFYSF